MAMAQEMDAEAVHQPLRGAPVLLDAQGVRGERAGDRGAQGAAAQNLGAV